MELKVKMQLQELPEVYEGFSVKELLQVLREIQSPQGTKASSDKISAMNDLVREFKLTPVHQGQKHEFL